MTRAGEKIMKESLLVEVLTVSGCSRWQKVKSLAKVVIEELAICHIQYREVNVVEEIDYAVQLGVLSTPAIALNGELFFSSQPSANQLRAAIEQRLKGGKWIRRPGCKWGDLLDRGPR